MYSFKSNLSSLSMGRPEIHIGHIKPLYACIPKVFYIPRERKTIGYPASLHNFASGTLKTSVWSQMVLPLLGHIAYNTIIQKKLCAQVKMHKSESLLRLLLFVRSHDVALPSGWCIWFSTVWNMFIDIVYIVIYIYICLER